MHWGGHGAVRRCARVTYVYMPFICCTKEERYMCRSASIIGGNLNLSDYAAASYSLRKVSFTHSHDGFHFLAIVEYWFKQVIFVQRIFFTLVSKLYCNWHCVKVFKIQTHSREQLLVKDPSWRTSYQGSRLLFAPTLIMLA